MEVVVCLVEMQVVRAWKIYYTSHQVNLSNQHKATEVCLLDIQFPLLFVMHIIHEI